MNVRITPRGAPNRRDVYSAASIVCDGRTLFLFGRTAWQYPDDVAEIPLAEVAGLELDEEGACP